MLKRGALIVAIAIVVPVLGTALFHRYNIEHTLSYGCGYLAGLKAAQPGIGAPERAYCKVFRTNAVKYGFNP